MWDRVKHMEELISAAVVDWFKLRIVMKQDKSKLKLFGSIFHCRRIMCTMHE